MKKSIYAIMTAVMLANCVVPAYAGVAFETTDKVVDKIDSVEFQPEAKPEVSVEEAKTDDTTDVPDVTIDITLDTSTDIVVEDNSDVIVKDDIIISIDEEKNTNSAAKNDQEVVIETPVAEGTKETIFESTDKVVGESHIVELVPDNTPETPEVIIPDAPKEDEIIDLPPVVVTPEPDNSFETTDKVVDKVDSFEFEPESKPEEDKSDATPSDAESVTTSTDNGGSGSNGSSSSHSHSRSSSSSSTIHYGSSNITPIDTRIVPTDTVDDVLPVADDGDDIALPKTGDSTGSAGLIAVISGLLALGLSFEKKSFLHIRKNNG